MVFDSPSKINSLIAKNIDVKKIVRKAQKNKTERDEGNRKIEIVNKETNKQTQKQANIPTPVPALFKIPQTLCPEAT